MKKLKSYLLRGGVLLGGSAILAKFLGFWRNRLLISSFEESQVDLVFAAFRIPDFFFYLFVGATLSVILIPQLVKLKKTEETQYISSFFWGVFLLFGTLSCLGIFAAPYLVDIFTTGFDDSLKLQIANLSKYLFGSVFLLSLSGVFSAYLQAHHKFLSLALSPLFYMASLCLGLYVWGNEFGILIVGYSAIIGAGLHLFLNVLYFYFKGGIIGFYWKKPQKNWHNFKGDFWRRVFNNSAFQINQSVDIWVASFLVTGAVTAFSIGTTFGQALFSIVGYSVANTAFPKFAKVKNNKKKQREILVSSLKWISFWTIPFAIIGAFYAKFLLATLFGLVGHTLEMSETVFFWTVISLPTGSMIPVFSRVFLANDDTVTPLYINIFSLVTATTIAIILALKVLPPEEGILGLAYGNFIANTLGTILFSYFLFKKTWKKN